MSHLLRDSKVFMCHERVVINGCCASHPTAVALETRCYLFYYNKGHGSIKLISFSLSFYFSHLVLKCWHEKKRQREQVACRIEEEWMKEEKLKASATVD